MLKFRAAVTNVYKHDHQTGFSILRVKPTHDTNDGFFKKNNIKSIVVLGTSSPPSPGQNLTIEGYTKEHETYKTQISAKTIHETKFTAKEHVASFLFSGVIRTLDKKDSQDLWNSFGERSLEAIAQNPKKIESSLGFEPGKMTKLKLEWNRIEKNSIVDQFNFLKNLHASDQASANIIEIYGGKSMEMANKQPYSFMTVPAVGFKTADAIALSLGFGSDSKSRITSGINHIIDGYLATGNTAIPRKQLIERASKLLNSNSNLIEDTISERIKTSHLIEREGKIINFDTHEKEIGIANNLHKLLQDSPKHPKKPFYESGFLNKEQKLAVSTSLNNNVMILTGGPGTGKTTTVKEIIKQNEQANFGDYKTVLVAPTGKAARRASQAADKEATTIHTLLQYNPQNGFKKNNDNKLDADLVIVDEASMVDLDLFNGLLKAMPSNSKLILVGDTNQLPSVGPGNVLADLINSNRLPLVELSEVHRQAKESNIVVVAHNIKSGTMPNFDSMSTDFHFIEAENDNDIRDKILELNKNIIPNDYGISIDNIQVLTPQRKSGVGTESLNTHLQETLNPKTDLSYTATFFGMEFRVKDRVMQTKNNKELDIFNGEVGKITFFDYKQKEGWVAFDSNLKKVPFDKFSDLKHANAATIHKSQGSEYGAVIVPISESHESMLSRQLLYTALTRGKQQVFFVGSKDVMESAINNTREMQRSTMLKSTLEDLLPNQQRLSNINNVDIGNFEP